MNNLSNNKAEDFMIKEYYKNMTPEMYQEAVQRAIKITEDRCLKEYKKELTSICNDFNEKLKKNALIAMDTLATEMIYELGDMLECYVSDPEYLDQKIDLVQNLYEKAMCNIGDYASDKYKTDAQAIKTYEKKKKKIQKIFGMSESET